MLSSPSSAPLECPRCGSGTRLPSGSRVDARSRGCVPDQPLLQKPLSSQGPILSRLGRHGKWRVTWGRIESPSLGRPCACSRLCHLGILAQTPPCNLFRVELGCKRILARVTILALTPRQSANRVWPRPTSVRCSTEGNHISETLLWSPPLASRITQQHRGGTQLHMGFGLTGTLAANGGGHGPFYGLAGRAMADHCSVSAQ